MVARRAPLFTVEQYLKLDEESDVRLEYLNGEITAMAGGTVPHSQISANTIGALVGFLKGKDCSALTSDARLRSSAAGLYTYPDIQIVCGDVLVVENTVTNPIVILEVLSDSTESFDRGEKFAQYQRIESLEQYVLIAQNRHRVEVYSRREAGSWSYLMVESLDGAARLDSVGIELPLADVYDKVRMPERSAEAPSPPS